MSIFNFTDYKQFLRTEFKNRPHKGRGELRKLSEKLGVHQTLVSQIFSGLKDFTVEQAWDIANYIGLSKIETKYFVCLVQIERAGSHSLKKHFLEYRDELRQESLQLSERVPSERTLSDLEKSVFYSSWVYSAVQLMTTLEEKPALLDISQRLKLSPQRIREILEFLKQTSMVMEKDGHFEPGLFMTHLDRSSPFVVKHHTNWRIRAIEKAESLTEQEIMYSVNVSLSRKDFNKLRETLVKVIQDFLKVVKDSPAEDLAQLNLDFFWI